MMNNDHAIIVAHDQNFGIGKNNQLPWHIKGDLKFFQTMTSTSPSESLGGEQKQNAVIMGRNTWQSLPEPYRPLKQRLNVVLTKNDSFLLPKGVLRGRNLTEALQNIAEKGCARIFVIGGATVYKEAMMSDLFSSLYVTEVEGVYDCDTFFPDYKNDFELEDSSPLNIENNYRFRFKTYKRKR